MESLTVTQFIAGQVEALLYDKLHQLLGVIAQDYDLSHGELVEKYLKYKNEVENPKVIYKATEVVEPEKPKRAPRKAKVTQKAESEEEAEPKEDDRKGKCEATTAKGLPCKNKAFGGGCFCRVHTKKDEEESKPAKSCPRPKKTRGKALEEEAKPEPKKRGRPKKPIDRSNPEVDKILEQLQTEKDSAPDKVKYPTLSKAGFLDQHGKPLAVAGGVAAGRHKQLVRGQPCGYRPAYEPGAS